MSASLPIPFAIGAVVWHARIEQTPIYVPCPACAGTLKATVILGNGETHVVWCDNCAASHAYDYDYDFRSGGVPPGQVGRYSIRAEVSPVTLASVEVRGDEVAYRATNNSYIYATALFATEAEARHHAETVLRPVAAQAEDNNFAQHVFHSRSKTAMMRQAGSAASWRKRRAEVAEDLARIDRRIARLKAKSKDGEATPVATGEVKA